MIPLSWPKILALALVLGALGIGCSAPTPQPGDTPVAAVTPGIPGVPPPPQVSRTTAQEPSVTDTDTSQAMEFETPQPAEAVIQFYKEELPRRGWAQKWEIPGQKQHQVAFERGDEETVIVVVTWGDSGGEGGTPQPSPTLVGILYISAKG